MEKVYAIGDIHGDFERLKLLLDQYSFIDHDENWIAGDITFICIGDLVDRGTRGIDVIKLLIKLEQQAKSQGGKIISVCGNHDALITALAFEYRGENAHFDCRELFKINGGNILEAITLSKDDEMFNWMQQRPLIYQNDNILFQHADTCDFYLTMGNNIDEINQNGLNKMKTASGAFSIFYNMTDCRYFEEIKYPKEIDRLNHINHYLSVFNADTIVHGHTRFIGNYPQSYYNKKVFNIDGSLSEGYRKDNNRGFIIDFSQAN